MDVSSPISAAIPSLDGPVLEALARTTEPLTLTEAHRRADVGSVSGVRRVLGRLVDCGLVHQVPGGYLLNRAHIAAPAVEALAGLHGALTERIADALHRWPGTIALAGLFGSVARRDGDGSSDIDVLVVSDSAGLSDFADALGDDLRSWTGNRAHVVALSCAALARLVDAREPIIENLRKDLVVLTGDRSILMEA